MSVNTDDASRLEACDRVKRHAWHLLDEASQAAVVVAEAYATGAVSAEEMEAARAKAWKSIKAKVWKSLGGAPCVPSQWYAAMAARICASAFWSAEGAEDVAKLTTAIEPHPLTEGIPSCPPPAN